jgi:predicted TIM-barrel fold metal-dependent hydrolase
MIDAYLHAGGPRFGSADLALRELARHRLTRGIVVLSPTCADFATLRRARELGGDHVRLVGNPYGDTEARRTELIAWQLAAGLTGLRLMTADVPANLSGLDLVGAAGRWLFAINVYDDPAVLATLLAWLDRHPAGRIVLPHCLKPVPFSALPDPAAFRTLLAHPRVNVILSRQGATGTTQPYPHPDLLPWVTDVISATGWSKILWASEYPVLHYRDETHPQALRWIRDLLPSVSDADYAAFTEGNARRLFFSEPAPADTAGPLPAWFAPDLENGWAAPVAPKGLKLTPRSARHLLAAYLDQLDPAAPGTYSDFLARWIDRHTP